MFLLVLGLLVSLVTAKEQVHTLLALNVTQNSFVVTKTVTLVRKE